MNTLMGAQFCYEAPLYFGDKFFVALFTIGAACCCGTPILGSLFCVKAYFIVGAPRHDLFSYTPFISFTLQNRVIQLHRYVNLNEGVRNPFFLDFKSHQFDGATHTFTSVEGP